MVLSKPDLSRAMVLAAVAAVELLACGLHTADHLPKLRIPDFAPWDVEVPLPVPIRGAPASAMPDLREFAAHGAVLRLRRDPTIARAMILTARCTDLLRLLQGARWLSTSQLHRRFFPHATLDAARKWLRKLVMARYLFVYRANRMAEALYTLGPEGKRVLETAGAEAIRLERQPPKQIEHFIAVNDLRIAAELAGALSYFFAYWELPAWGWRQSIIPDAVCAFTGKTFALEFDRGLEGVKFFVRTKIAAYERGFSGFPLTALIVVGDRQARMATLARAISSCRRTIFFTTLDQIRTQGFLAPIFHRNERDLGSRII